MKYDLLIKKSLAGGGDKGIERHVKRNKKMLVRDRIKLLLDQDSEFLELSPLAGLGKVIIILIYENSFFTNNVVLSTLCLQI